MAIAMNLPPNYIRLDPMNEIETHTEIVCNQNLFSELFAQKIASNEFITPSIIQSPHIYYDENMQGVLQFKIKKLTITQSLTALGYSIQERMIRALKTNVTITYLDMSHTIFGIESIFLLKDILMENNTIERINLTNCNFFTFTPIAEALVTNTKLEYLDLSNNRVHFEDVVNLIGALKFNTTLKVLDMGTNIFSHNEIYWEEQQNMLSIIQEAFTVNTTLEQITFNILYETAELIYNVLEMNTTLMVINIDIQFPEIDINYQMNNFEPGLYGIWTQPDDYEQILISNHERILQEEQHKKSAFKTKIDDIVKRNHIPSNLKKMEGFILAFTRRQLFLPEDLLISACRYLCL
jgi:hypothetical protein